MQAQTQTHTSRPLPVIIGTAGHVDHGKTSLVKALTNFETDRHPEERARGISIDFAVAPFNMSDGNVIGLIDVPGHEDFIKNMVAGASSIDILLLIVAADDGVMPQTREHLQIASHLGAVIVQPVITKIDLVDGDLKNLVALETLELVSSFSIPSRDPIFVSNLSGAGIPELRHSIEALATDLLNKKNELKSPSEEAFRMYIRACFQIKGHGNVVTGVPCSGALSTGDTLELFSTYHPRNNSAPNSKAGTSSRINTVIASAQVRSIQNYRSEHDSTAAHISSALNIKGPQFDLLERGSLLASPGIFEPSSELMVWFKNSSTTHILKRGKRYQIHLGTYSGNAVVYPVGTNAIEPGEYAVIRARLQYPHIFLAGDRFILRDLNKSSSSSVGGGVILSRKGVRVKSREKDHYLKNAHEAIDVYHQDGNPLALECTLSRQMFFTKQDLLHINNLKKVSAREIQEYTCNGFILQISENLFLNNSESKELHRRLSSQLSRYHKKNPLQRGMKVDHFCSLFQIESVSDSAFSKAFEQYPDIVLSKGFISLRSFKPSLEGKELASLEKARAMFQKAPAYAKGTLVETLGVSTPALDKILLLLQSSDEVRIIGTLALSVPFLASLREALSNSFGASSEGFTLSDFRELSGLSRNFAVPVLEFFDGEGFTKRVPDQRRVILRDFKS